MGLKYLDLAVLVTCERVTEGDLGVLVAIKYAQDVRCLVARTKASGGTNCCRCSLPDVYFLSCCKMIQVNGSQSNLVLVANRFMSIPYRVCK